MYRREFLQAVGGSVTPFYCEYGKEDGMVMRQGRWSQAADLTCFSSNLGLNMQRTLGTPSAVTAQFFIGGDASRSNGGGTTFRRCYAIVEWSLDGNTTRRVVSVYNGCSITGIATSVNIRVVDRSFFTGIPINYSYPVSVQLGLGTRAAQQQPPLLDLNTGNITAPPAGVGSLNFAASCLTLFGFKDVGIISSFTYAYNNDAAGTGLRPDMSLSFTGPSPGFTVLGRSQLEQIWIPMPPGAEVVRYFTGTVTTGDTNFYTVLGIDG